MNSFINIKLRCLMYLMLIPIGIVYTSYIFTESNDDTIPVIFVHWGNPDFLKHSLWQAKQFNKHVILIGDSSTKHYRDLNIEWRNIEDYNKSSNYFASIYVHMSYQPYEFEIKCFQRWFILEEFMRINKIPLAFYTDSDVMLYCDISKEYQDNFKEYDVSLISEGQNHYKGGIVSYWNTKGVKSFSDYLKNYYNDKEKIAEALKNYKENPGTFYHDDIPLTLYFAKDNKTTLKIAAINKIIHNALFDFAIWVDRHDEEDGTNVFFTVKKHDSLCFQMKDIHWVNNVPYCYSPTLKKDLRLKSLHFQGLCKNFIADYKVKNNA